MDSFRAVFELDRALFPMVWFEGEVVHLVEGVSDRGSKVRRASPLPLGVGVLSVLPTAPGSRRGYVTTCTGPSSASTRGIADPFFGRPTHRLLRDARGVSGDTVLMGESVW